LVLLVLILFLSGFNIYQRIFWKTDWDESILKFGPEIIAFKEHIDTVRNTSADKTPWTPRPKELFRFDPNTLGKEGWIRLGFSPKQAASILKYRTAGAVFRKPEDIKKLFVVDEARYQELERFIKIEAIDEPVEKNWKKDTFDSKPKWEKEKDKPIVLELNNADSASLVQVKGIGPFFARVIMEYREKLGGYRTKEQVLEVYGMDSAKYARIENQLIVDSTNYVRININEATLKMLVRHPYLNFNQAKAIVNYRKQHGVFTELSELENIHLLKGETYRKIAPYLSVH